MRKNWVKKKKNGEKNLSEHLKWYETSREAKKKKKKWEKKLRGMKKNCNKQKNPKTKVALKLPELLKQIHFQRGGCPWISETISRSLQRQGETKKKKKKETHTP